MTVKKKKVSEETTVMPPEKISIQKLAYDIVKIENLNRKSIFKDQFKGIKLYVTDDVILLIDGGFDYIQFQRLIMYMNVYMMTV